MTKTTFEATLPDGSTAKRTSENRTYTHAIVGRYGYARAVSYAKETDLHESNGGYYFDRAAGKAEVLYRDTPEEARAEALEELNGAKTVAEYVAMKVAADLAAVEARKAEGHYDAWHAISWAGRPDLAAKAVGKESKTGYWVDVRAVEARVAAKKFVKGGDRG